ncbi:MAG: putative sporulation protein YtxC [Clostridiales bacterium]|nr:putative sporulation protein YtxC [Clostridiales bacterium]
MPSWFISAETYQVDLKALLGRRLSQAGASFALDTAPGGAIAVTLRGAYARESLAQALGRLLAHDLQTLELAGMADKLPLTLAEKEAVLTEAIAHARRREQLDALQGELAAYLGENRRIALDGYMRFRMRGQLLLWQLCVQQAAAEHLLQMEFFELMQAMGKLADTQKNRIGELRLCIHAEGTYTLTDDSDVRIEYIDYSPEGIVQILTGMAPGRIVVYDLAGTPSTRLTDALRQVFPGRVQIYR